MPEPLLEFSKGLMPSDAFSITELMDHLVDVDVQMDENGKDANYMLVRIGY